MIRVGLRGTAGSIGTVPASVSSSRASSVGPTGTPGRGAGPKAVSNSVGLLLPPIGISTVVFSMVGEVNRPRHLLPRASKGGLEGTISGLI